MLILPLSDARVSAGYHLAIGSKLKTEGGKNFVGVLSHPYQLTNVLV